MNNRKNMSMQKPNILLIMSDDMGYSDLGCYGGEIKTPNLDFLAKRGLRFTQFYNTARCCPTRASLLTGLHPHQVDVGHMINNDGIDGYLGDLSHDSITLAEMLKDAGYRNYMAGKWNVTRFWGRDDSKHNWPVNRGFDRYRGIVRGGGQYFELMEINEDLETLDLPGDETFYLTDDIADSSCRFINDHFSEHSDKPFFMYTAFTAPHWPLQAPENEVQKYQGRFSKGWDVLRDERYKRMKKLGVIDKNLDLSQRDEDVPAWNDEKHKHWQERRMEVYAAQIDIMDQGIGRIIDTLKKLGQFDNTLIIFLADNGGCAEEIASGWSHFLMGKMFDENLRTRAGKPIKIGNDVDISPGGRDTYCSYGLPWANVSNTPFRMYKHWVHEGGISTPFIVHWPEGIKTSGEIRNAVHQLPDIMATFADVSGGNYPDEYNGHSIKKTDGVSMLTSFKDDSGGREYCFWEHEGNKAVRKGKYKMVCKYPGKWELYDMETDRSELYNIIEEHSELVLELKHKYNEWAKRCNVEAWDDVLEKRKQSSIRN